MDSGVGAGPPPPPSGTARMRTSARPLARLSGEAFAEGICVSSLAAAFGRGYSRAPSRALAYQSDLAI